MSATLSPLLSSNTHQSRCAAVSSGIKVLGIRLASRRGIHRAQSRQIFRSTLAPTITPCADREVETLGKAVDQDGFALDGLDLSFIGSFQCAQAIELRDARLGLAREDPALPSDGPVQIPSELTFAPVHRQLEPVQAVNPAGPKPTLVLLLSF